MLLSRSLEQISLSDPPTDLDNVDIIGYGRIEVSSNDNIHNIAETILNSALTSAEYGQAGNMTIYGNRAGRELLEERNEMKKWMKRLENKLQETDTKLEKTDTELQNTKIELRKTDTKLQKTDTELQNTKIELRKTDTELQNTKIELRKTDTELQNTKTELQKTDTKLQNTKTELQKTDTKLQKTESKLQADITRLQYRVQDLTLASDGYHKIRNRFLEVYRRDILANIDGQGRRTIGEGNKAAHEGDAVADASLYSSGYRTEHPEILHDLYGQTADQISHLARIGNFDAIFTLNAHATWQADRLSYIPQDAAEAFTAFVDELTLKPDGSLSDGTTSPSKAYDEFWTAYKRLNKHPTERMVVLCGSGTPFMRLPDDSVRDLPMTYPFLLNDKKSWSVIPRASFKIPPDFQKQMQARLREDQLYAAGYYQFLNVAPIRTPNVAGNFADLYNSDGTAHAVQDRKNMASCYLNPLPIESNPAAFTAALANESPILVSTAPTALPTVPLFKYTAVLPIPPARKV